MTAPVTYPLALAACGARWGAPDHEMLYDGCPVASWPWVPGDDRRIYGTTSLTELGELVLCVARGDAVESWLLAGDDLTTDPLTPLPDALDAALAWMLAHDGVAR